MQIVTLLGQILESGKMTLSTKNKEDIEITAVNKRIDVNVKNKEFIKDIVASVREGSNTVGIKNTIKESPEIVKTAKSTRDLVDNAANELADEGLTITLSYKGDVIATIGAQASSKISRLITGTKAVEINNLGKLIELGIKII